MAQKTNLQKTFSTSGGDTITNKQGIGFFQALTLLFIGLKLTDQIDWSWFWVLSPLLLGFVLVVLGAFLIAIAAVASERDL